MQSPTVVLTPQQKKDKHAEVQREYMKRQKMGWEAYSMCNENLNNQINQLNTQLNEKSNNIILLQQLIAEKETTNSLRGLQIQRELNESINTIANLNQQLQEKNNIITQMQMQSQNVVNVNNDENVIQLTNQLSQKEETITRLQNQVNNLTSSNNSKDETITRLQNQVNNLTSSNNSKDETISQLSVRQVELQNQVNNCVTPDINQRLQELSAVINNKEEQEQLCLQTISNLNSENTGLKIYRDIVSELNSKYPKILPSFVNEIQQAGNESAYPEINNWAREQRSKITPNEIIPLTSFRNLSPIQVQPSPAILNPQVNLQNPQIIPNPNIPYVRFADLVSNQQPLVNNNHPMFNDPNFQPWLNLYTSNMKDTSEYSRLYQNLRNRHGETPIKIAKQYSII